MLLLAVCLKVVDTLKLQGVDAYIAAACSVARRQQQKESVLEPTNEWKWSLAARTW